MHNSKQHMLLCITRGRCDEEEHHAMTISIQGLTYIVRLVWLCWKLHNSHYMYGCRQWACTCSWAHFKIKLITFGIISCNANLLSIDHCVLVGTVKYKKKYNSWSYNDCCENGVGNCGIEHLQVCTVFRSVLRTGHCINLTCAILGTMYFCSALK